MVGNRSFKSYISDRFYNNFYSYIDKYIEENQHSLDLDIRNVHEVGGVSLADIEVKFASINDLPGMGIEFDVAIEVIIEASERDYHYDDYDVCTQWFLLSCSGNLEKSLDDFEINGIEVYTQRNKIDKPLSDSLVPYMWADQLDSVAYDFLNKHYPEALKEPVALEPMELASKMGLTLDTRSSRDFTDPYSLVYGHDMVQGRMFGDLPLYKEEEFFRENRTGELLLPDRSHSLEIYAVILTNSSDSMIFNPDIYKGGLSDLIKYADDNALYLHDEMTEDLRGRADEDLQIVSLTTCSSEFTDARTIVLAVME